MFVRSKSDKWHEEVPGSRWFRADLHLHTIDDHPGGRAKLPAALHELTSHALDKYAHEYLRGLVRAGIQVAALTPHAVKTGSDPSSSAVWSIVNLWNHGVDADGVPYRNKIYAVFPGFEPSFKCGKDGLHLLFLFDPEIGIEQYMATFNTLMGAVEPWKGTTLQVSNRTASEAFRDLRDSHGRTEGRWSYLVIAPHIDAAKGLFGAQKGEVLALFEHDELAALELSDNKTPERAFEGRAWMRDGAQRYRHALVHSSDAYCISSDGDGSRFPIGHRWTWVKLATPRIESLRQAFLANDSRTRIAFRETASGKLSAEADTLESVPSGRHWLRRIVISGGTSFFGGTCDGKPRRVVVPLSPDLTCVIGGSMSGKSTLLDGLRLSADARLPDNEQLRRQVVGRGQQLSAGDATVRFDTPGQPDSSPLRDRFPAYFLTQSELQLLSSDHEGIEQLLMHLVPGTNACVRELRDELENVTRELASTIERRETTRQSLDEATQALADCAQAEKDISQFRSAGIERLRPIDATESTLKDLAQLADLHLKAFNAFVLSLEDSRPKFLEYEVDGDKLFASRWAELDAQTRAFTSLVDALSSEVAVESARVAEVRATVLCEVRNLLAEAGVDAERMKEFDRLQTVVAQKESWTGKQATLREREQKLEAEFASLRERARTARDGIRDAMNTVIDVVDDAFDGYIRVVRHDGAHHEELERFISNLKQRGVTRWWNEAKSQGQLSAESLADAYNNDALDKVGMSSVVQSSFREKMTSRTLDELHAIQCEDRYSIEHCVDPVTKEFRDIAFLSGGRRVNVLLSLLLKSDDKRPLVIDQPEDDLDAKFLSETVLPVLRLLKGQRQIIVATHDANIVVNADADLVVVLEADANHGTVAHFGAIDDPAVREAIVRTVDGGREAFELRQAKYGY